MSKRTTEVELKPIIWRHPGLRRRKHKTVYGPAYRPLPRRQKRAAVKSGGKPIHLSGSERDALERYRERGLDEWFAALGLTDRLATMDATEVETFRHAFARFVGALPLAYLHTVVVGENEDTGELLVISCAIPATPRLSWRPPREDN